MKYLLFLVGIATLFLWLAPKLLDGLGYLASPWYVMVEAPAAISGRILTHSANRGKYRFMLAGRRETFDFDCFQNQALWSGGRLGPYLRDGDSVYKKPNSDTLQVFRGGRVSIWTCSSQP